MDDPRFSFPDWEFLVALTLVAIGVAGQVYIMVQAVQATLP